MSNPFQIEDDPDLSFGDEDFLLDSIDLEAIAAKALQTKPATGANISEANSNPQQNQTNQDTTQNTKQFVPFSKSTGVTIRNTTISSGSSNVSTPQPRANKFNFKLKRSPENDQVGSSHSRPVLTPVQNSPCLESNNGVPSGSSGSASANDEFGGRFPGTGTKNASHGLRVPHVQPQSSHAAQPPMGVTVKRDGTSITRKPQMNSNPQVNQGSPSFNMCVSSAQELDNRNTSMSGHHSHPGRGQSTCTANGKYFQKYVPPSPDASPYKSGSLHPLRTSQRMNETNTSVTQLRNPSTNSNMPLSNRPNLASPYMHGTNSASPKTSLRTNSIAAKSKPTLHVSDPSNQPYQSFQRYQGPTTMQTLTAPSQRKNQPHSTPQTNSQFQHRSQSPMHASTPGYRTPTGGPSPGSSRFQGVTTPLQPMGQASRYPTTPRTGASTFNTTGGTPGMRGVGSRPGATQQVPLLTPRVAQLCQTPSGNGSRSTIRTRTRMFPGPAGVLPKLKPGQKLDDAVVEDLPPTEKKPKQSLDDSLTSQSSQDNVDEFQRGAWLTMKTELGRAAQSILSSYNIAVVLRKASLKQLPRKQVPNLCVMIRQVTQTGCDACVMVKDPSGEMQGTLHRRIVEDHQADLKPGSVMVLRKVGVLSPSIRNHYLNITPGNLVQIYPAESASVSCSQASPSKSQESHSQVNRSPDKVDCQEQQSTFTKTKDSNRHSYQKSPNNQPKNTIITNSTAHPRTKMLLIEGINTPERNHKSSLGNTKSKKPDNCLEEEDLEQQNKSSYIEGTEHQAAKRTQSNNCLPHAEDSGISLDACSGETSLSDRQNLQEKKNGIDQVNNANSWLRKRHTSPDGMDGQTGAETRSDVPAKRRCLNVETTKDLSMPKPSLSASKPSLSASNISVNRQVYLTSEEISKAAEENFASLLEGIEDEFFDDF